MTLRSGLGARKAVVLEANEPLGFATAASIDHRPSEPPARVPSPDYFLTSNRPRGHRGSGEMRQFAGRCRPGQHCAASAGNREIAKSTSRTSAPIASATNSTCRIRPSILRIGPPESVPVCTPRRWCGGCGWFRCGILRPPRGHKTLGRLPRMEHGGANHQSCSGSPRHRDRQRRVRRDGGLESHPEGHRRAAARCGGQIRSVEVLDPRAALGSPGTRSAGREAPRVLSRYQGTALRDAGGPPVRAHARVGAWRQDECLGPCQPAVFADGPQGGRAGRVGDPVADRLPGDCPLLRSGRAADRRLRRHRRLGSAAGQQGPAAAAGAAVRRAADDEGHDQARAASRGRAAREHDPTDPWVSGVPLLRELRRRLRHGVVLLLRGSSPAVRAEDRASHDSVQRGRGADPDRRRRSGARRPVPSIVRPAPSVRPWRRSSWSERAASIRRASC